MSSPMESQAATFFWLLTNKLSLFAAPVQAGGDEKAVTSRYLNGVWHMVLFTAHATCGPSDSKVDKLEVPVSSVCVERKQHGRSWEPAFSCPCSRPFVFCSLFIHCSYCSLCAAVYFSIRTSFVPGQRQRERRFLLHRLRINFLLFGGAAEL